LQRNTADERFSTAPHCRTLCKGCIDHLGGVSFLIEKKSRPSVE